MGVGVAGRSFSMSASAIGEPVPMGRPEVDEIVNTTRGDRGAGDDTTARLLVNVGVVGGPAGIGSSVTSASASIGGPGIDEAVSETTGGDWIGDVGTDRLVVAAVFTARGPAVATLTAHVRVAGTSSGVAAGVKSAPSLDIRPGLGGTANQAPASGITAEKSPLWPWLFVREIHN